MIQPVKSFRVLSLSVKGFKGFAEETAFTFGEMNTITGHNGQGKTSIADAIAFAITGVPFYGGGQARPPVSPEHQGHLCEDGVFGRERRCAPPLPPA